MKNLIRKVLQTFGFTIDRHFEIRRWQPPTNPLKRAKRILDPELTKTVDWSHGDKSLEQLASSKYYQLWKEFNGGVKKYSYFHLYDKLFGEFAGKSPRILEIGVFHGASIRTWKKFFGPGSVIVGIDIDPQCAQYELKDEDIYVRIGSQSDEKFLASLRDEFGEFDIIIDDGSHQSKHVVASFNYAFPNCLGANGIYFIEDLNTSYWNNYRTSQYSGMDLVLSLCELMHQFYYENAAKDYSHADYRESYPAPMISTQISEVRVFDAAAAIYKKPVYPPMVYWT